MNETAYIIFNNSELEYEWVQLDITSCNCPRSLLQKNGSYSINFKYQLQSV